MLRGYFRLHPLVARVYCEPLPIWSTPLKLLHKMASKDILAINLKYYRYQCILSQEKFAEFLGSTLPYINQLENGRRKPTLELLDKFSQKLNITSAYLITFNEKHYIIAKRIDEKK